MSRRMEYTILISAMVIGIAAPMMALISCWFMATIADVTGKLFGSRFRGAFDMPHYHPAFVASDIVDHSQTPFVQLYLYTFPAVPVVPLTPAVPVPAPADAVPPFPPAAVIVPVFVSVS